MKTSPIAAALVFLVAFFAGTAPALAHTSLKSSDPKKNQTVEGLRRVTLEFTESVRFPIVVINGADGLRYDEGKPKIDGQRVSQGVVDDLPTGEYTIAYRVVSKDGHSIEGEIPFKVKAPPSPVAPSPSVSAADAGMPSAAAPDPALTAIPAVTAVSVSPADDGAGIPGWVWIVVFGIAGVGIGMAFSMRKKP